MFNQLSITIIVNVSVNFIETFCHSPFAIDMYPSDISEKTEQKTLESNSFLSLSVRFPLILDGFYCCWFGIIIVVVLTGTALAQLKSNQLEFNCLIATCIAVHGFTIFSTTNDQHYLLLCWQNSRWNAMKDKQHYLNKNHRLNSIFWSVGIYQALVCEYNWGWNREIFSTNSISL